MVANGTDPILFVTDDKRDTLSVLADGVDIEAFKCIALGSNADGDITGVLPAATGDRVYGLSINARILSTEFGANTTKQYATVSRGNIALATVEPGQVIAVGDVVTPVGTTGNVQAQAAPTEYAVGVALSSSDGTGTLAVPHLVNVALNKA